MSDNLLSDIFSKYNDYEENQGNNLTSLLPDKSQNSLLQHLPKIVDDLFVKLFDFDLLDFINLQDFFDVKNIQKFENIKWPITRKFRNI